METYDRPTLARLGQALRSAGYRFVTVTPETHRRVNTRADARGRAAAASLRDVFGWSRPFPPEALPAPILDLAERAGVLREDGPYLRSTVRFATLGDGIFVHSAYPTEEADAVFFGPDTYRFCRLVRAERPDLATRVVDIGCGSGVGGIVAGRHRGSRIVLADVNPAALALAATNAELAGVAPRAEIVASDILANVTGAFDLVIANPPYMADPGRRAYRDGGGAHGEALALRIAREALERLSPGGRLVLYTGAAIVDGEDTFLAAVRTICDASAASWRYSELDPDVFGEEIERSDAYADVERIAAVGLVATVSSAR